MSILSAGRSLTTNHSDYSTCQCTAFQIKDCCATPSTPLARKTFLTIKGLKAANKTQNHKNHRFGSVRRPFGETSDNAVCLIWTLGKPLALATQSSCQKACQSESEKCLLEQHCKLGPYVAVVGAVLKNGSRTRLCPQSFLAPRLTHALIANSDVLPARDLSGFGDGYFLSCWTRCKGFV